MWDQFHLLDLLCLGFAPPFPLWNLLAIIAWDVSSACTQGSLVYLPW